jgi:serine/threonine-protein kinase HipA
MIRGQDNEGPSTSFRSATHIIKFWNQDEYPELAANEFFCLTVAQKLGMQVPSFQMSDDGGALVIERFDLKPQGG